MDFAKSVAVTQPLSCIQKHSGSEMMNNFCEPCRFFPQSLIGLTLFGPSSLKIPVIKRFSCLLPISRSTSSLHSSLCDSLCRGAAINPGSDPVLHFWLINLWATICLIKIGTSALIMIPATPTAIAERYSLAVGTSVYLSSEAVRLPKLSLIFASNGKKKKKKNKVEF